ncbi:MAG: helicase-related protein [Bacilli bacterium]|jgi:competence protein ComFA
MEGFFICPICGNDNKEFFGIRNGKYYCRKCISFTGEKCNYIKPKPLDIQLKLDYELTDQQKEIAQKTKENFINKKNTLIYAVCGAGKTELVFEVMEYALQNGLQIGFTVPRKEVVIELGMRIKHAFPLAKVISVYGGHHDVLRGNIIVLTTHQLFRYENYFDLLIFDEIDAFPYKGNETLESFFKKSCRGNYVIMSATPSNELINEMNKSGGLLTLFSRFHGFEIPVPRIKYGFYWLNIILIILKTKSYLKNDKVVFIFCPTIHDAEVVWKIMKIFIKNGGLIHSKIKNGSKIIEEFKKGNLKYLVTTSILERGITIKKLQVLIFCADHEIFSKDALIQISGRVGRKSEEPFGDVIYYITKENAAIFDSIKDIEEKNALLQNMF